MVDVVVDHVVLRVVVAEEAVVAVVVVLLLDAPLLLQVGVVPQQLVSTFKLEEEDINSTDFEQCCQLSKFDLFLSWIVLGWRAGGSNPRKGTDTIFHHSVAVP